MDCDHDGDDKDCDDDGDDDDDDNDKVTACITGVQLCGQAVQLHLFHLVLHT